MKTSEKIIGLKELREDTEKYIGEVKRGKSFVVVRRSKPIFRITSPDEEESGWETILDFRKEGGISAKKLLARMRKP